MGLNNNLFAKIIIGISHEAVDRAFDYRVPEELASKICIGDGVIVPFGKGNTPRKGFVIALSDKSDYDENLLKSIISIDEKTLGLEESIINLAAWMHHRYSSTMIACMQTVLPVKKKVKENNIRSVVLVATGDTLINELAEAGKNKRGKSRFILLQELKKYGELPFDIITEKLGVSSSVIKTLEKKGIVRIDRIRSYRNPKVIDGGEDKLVVLSDEQEIALRNITSRMDSDNPGTTLLYGITGSGKTEVYMRVIEKCVNEGKKAIVLIPEIALTFQTLMRFYGRFGDRVSVIHSRLSDGERFDQYERVKNGDVDIIIGPRSALFMPFDNIGVIIIDEEHETSYKSEKMPKYHAREVAEYIAIKHKALLLLGSATPSVDSYYKAMNGEYNLEVLTKRSNGAYRPRVHVCDMRAELKKGNKSFFSEKLRELLTERITKGEQAMFFINRRGLAGFISCRECGFVLKCPHCDVSLSEHNGSRMVCHYCGYTTPKPTVCPECGSKYFAGFRAGTERIEQEIKKIYPSVRVLRMDADTTSNKDDYEKILTSFAEGQADILVGTQMIVKGHDFPNVTLVGAIAADLSLYAADYRSAERTFQLITQAAGRAGRGEKKGDVVIQTYQPDNYAIKYSLEQDYEAYYKEEIVYRELSDYPPCGHMMAIQMYCMNENYLDSMAETISDSIKEYVKANNLVMIGPSKAVISKIKDIYRMVIYVKGKDVETLVNVRDIIDGLTDIDKNKLGIQYDVDPVGSF